MSSTSRLDEETVTHQSVKWVSSEVVPGVRFLINLMSLDRKIELTRRVREIGRKVEFFEASSDPRQRLEVAVLVNEIDREYVSWGLVAIEGLNVDGELATPELLLSKGPLPLAMEALTHVKAECGLTDEERKN